MIYKVVEKRCTSCGAENFFVSVLIIVLCQKPETCFIATFKSQQGRIITRENMSVKEYATDSVTNSSSFI